MDLLYFPGRPFAEFALAAFCILAAGQSVHTAIRWMSSSSKTRYLSLSYRILIVMHLTIDALFVDSLGHGWLPSSAVFGRLCIPMEWLLWANAAVILLGAAYLIVCRQPGVIIQLAGIALMLPPVIRAFSQDYLALIIVDMTIFAFFVPYKLLEDYRKSYSSVSSSAEVTAIKQMPEGVALAAPDGRILMSNDSMRRLLSQHGIAVDLSNLQMIRDAVAGGAIGAQWQVSFDETVVGRTRCTRILAVDITEERSVQQRAEQANAKLLETEALLRDTLDGVRDAAADEALIRMRSRLHDVIGQRLSLLHRYLEDQNIDYGRLEQMEPMLKGIIADLHEDAELDWRLELQSIVSAFALVGVEVRVEGALPDDGEVAEACVGIVREAATNAVRHANASQVRALFEEVGDVLELRICDNGTPLASGAVREGQGIRGMREAALACGGSLHIEREPVFTLTARFPKIGESPADGKVRQLRLDGLEAR